jgi:WD40 repeat protein
MLAVWDTETGKPVGPPRGPFRLPLISPDGRTVFSGGTAGQGRFWDVETGRPLPPLIEQASPLIRPIAFSPDGRLLLTSSQEPLVHVWDTRTGRPAIPALPVGGPCSYAWFSADGSRILTWAGDVYTDYRPSYGAGVSVSPPVRVWDTRTGQPLTPAIGDDRINRRVLFSPDGSHVLTFDGRERRGAWLWNLSPDDRPVAELARLSTLLSGRQVDDRFGLVPVDRVTLQAAWDAGAGER